MPKGLWWIVDIASFCTFLATVVLVVSRYASLPAEIPIHFGPSGRPDGWGSRDTIFLLPVLAAMLQAMLTAAPFFPHHMHLLGPRTPENLSAAIAMLRILKWEAMTLFFFLADAMTRSAALGWVPVVFLSILLGTAVIGIWQSSRTSA